MQMGEEETDTMKMKKKKTARRAGHGWLADDTLGRGPGRQVLLASIGSECLSSGGDS